MWDWMARNRLAAAAFCVAAAYCPGLFSGATSPRWWVIAIGLPLASDLDPRKLDPVVAWCLTAGLAWAAASLTFAPDVAGGALDLLFLVLLALTMTAAAGVDDVKPVVSAFGWGVAISAALAVLQTLGWSPVEQISAPAGLFFSSEVLAETAAPILAWAAFERRWVLAAAMSAPLALCGSRIAVFAVAVGLICGWRASRSIKAGFLLAAAVVAAASVWALGVGKLSSGAERIGLWMTAVDSLTPVGGGIGWWAAAHPGAFDEFVHSDALQMMVELGAGAAFFFAAAAIVALRARAAEPGEIAACAAICTEIAVSFPLHFPASGFLAAVLAGGMARRRSDVRGLELLRGAGAEPAVRREFPRVAAVGNGGHGRAEGVPVRPAIAGVGARRAGEAGGSLT